VINFLFLFLYLDNKGDDRQLDLESLRAFSNGKSFRNMLTRAENTKFIHDQYASFTRLADWGYNIDSSCCRLCGSLPKPSVTFSPLALITTVDRSAPPGSGNSWPSP